VTAPPEGSIDAVIAQRHRRRLIRERISMVCAGAIITAMFAAFYSILTG
jgi:hypothetical protein